jgi:hypothetical protein
MFVLPTFNLGVVGTVFAAGGFNISTRDTEANIAASTPTNPSGEVTIAYGTDTEDFYIWDGSSWYVYKNI